MLSYMFPGPFRLGDATSANRLAASRNYERIFLAEAHPELPGG